MANLYNHMSSLSSVRGISPSMSLRNNVDFERQYLAELLAEHQKLGPFMQVLPLCSRLLNQEILRVSGKNAITPNKDFSDLERMQLASPGLTAPSDITPNYTLSGTQGMSVDWKLPPVIPNSCIVKRISRLDVPTDIYPKFNFVGRLLGPRGHSLKRVEAATGCRAYIRGKGSIKEQEKEELLRQKAGYEHLNEPLHILIEAELPANIVEIKLKQAKDIIEELLKPVEESKDLYKRNQLRELAMLNSKSYREESPQMSGSASPFTSDEMNDPELINRASLHHEASCI